MLLEDLLSLPVGTPVFGEVELPTTVPGVIASLKDGSHFIRWADGYSSIALGRVRDYDEYIAAHTELQPKAAPARRVRCRTDHSGVGDIFPDYTSRVRRP
jgi:hypothetical protein